MLSWIGLTCEGNAVNFNRLQRRGGRRNWHTNLPVSWSSGILSARSKPALFKLQAPQAKFQRWVWLKIKHQGLRKFWSMFPLTRVPFWYRFFEPQPDVQAFQVRNPHLAVRRCNFWLESTFRRYVVIRSGQFGEGSFSLQSKPAVWAPKVCCSNLLFGSNSPSLDFLGGLSLKPAESTRMEAGDWRAHAVLSRTRGRLFVALGLFL